ncbi:MAG TPA: 4Fe-4S binding protein, partial [Candidatus Cloacimonas sp.]|nr:4Fe-4S binding protein [Candidatus Cloacimonas sp.]
LKDVPYLSPALIMDGIIPSRIEIPTSFRNYRIPDADIKSVKITQKALKYVPDIARKAFRKVYYFYPEVSERCRRCGICVKSCPVKAISRQGEDIPVIHKERCIKCLCCHELCPYQAIDIKKSLLARLGV